MKIVYGARCTWWDTIDRAAEQPLAPDLCATCGKKHLFGIPPACARGAHTARGLPCCGPRWSASSDRSRSTSNLPSVLPLLAIAAALLACSTTGRTSRNNQRARDASLANRDVRRVVVARPGSNRPSVPARRRPDLTKDHQPVD